jgi:hypothetical protein
MEKDRKAEQPKTANKPIFYENPYDIETFFEGMNIAIEHGKEFQYIDRFITHMRIDPLQDTADISFKVLSQDLKLLEYSD